MNIESNSLQNSSQMCKACKLFFAAEAFKGFCSTCYKKQQGGPTKEESKKAIEKIQLKQVQVTKPEQATDKENLQKDKTRCFDCNRKLRNLGVECKCQFVFCNMHRLPEDHKCTFNHMNAGIKKLEKALVKVSNGKIEQLE